MGFWGSTGCAPVTRPPPVRTLHEPPQAKAYMAERVELVQGHHEWMGKMRHGRPYAWDGTGWRNALGYAWELEHGPLPPGVAVVRACKDIYCINPRHMLLLPVTLARKAAPLRSKCKRGHWKFKGERCMPCRRKTWRDHNDRRRGKPKRSRWPGRREWRNKDT